VCVCVYIYIYILNLQYKADLCGKKGLVRGDKLTPPLEQLPVPERTFVHVNARVEFETRNQITSVS